MSAPISKSSPSPGSPCDGGAQFDGAQFDGAKALLRAWGRGLTPDPWLTVSEWAGRYRNRAYGDLVREMPVFAAGCLSTWCSRKCVPAPGLVAHISERDSPRAS